MCFCWTWWHRPVIKALKGRGSGIQGHLWLYGQLKVSLSYMRPRFLKRLFLWSIALNTFAVLFCFFFHPYTACNGMWRRPLQWTEGRATDLWGCHAEVVLLVMIDLQMLCRHTTAPASNPSGPAPGLARLICLLAKTCRVYCPPPPGLLSNVTLSTKPAGHHTQV